jgi:hypothetical protein
VGAGRGRADPEGPAPHSGRPQDPPTAHTAAVTYYVPAALQPALAAQLAGVVRELGGRPPVTVQPLPEVAGTSYGGHA